MNAVTGRIALLLAASALFSGVSVAAPLGEELLAPAAPRPAPRSRPEATPVPAAYTPRSVVYAAKSRDGRFIATVEKGENDYQLWLHPAGNTPELPRLLVSGPVRISAPSFNAAGTLLAFADERDDLKGDIRLLDLAKPDAEPRRLTGNDAGEDAPVFSGNHLLYQRRFPGSESSEIVRLDLVTGKGEPLPIGIDASFAAPSPDGDKIVFMSRSSDPGGDLWLFDGKSGSVKQLTSGPERDLYPAFEDAGSILFTRFAPPAGDSATGPVGGVIFRLKLDRKGSEGLPAAFPLTSGLLSSVAPLPAGESILFVADGAGGGQLLSLPSSGELPDRADVASQWELARRLIERQPPEPAMARLATLRVLAREDAPTREGALASLALASLLERDADAKGAEERYAETASRYPAFPEEAALAEIGRLRLEGARRCRDVVVAGKRQGVLAEVRQEMLRVANGKGPNAAARALIDGARLTAEFGSGGEDHLAAISLLEKAGADPATSRPLRAEAAYRRAALLARIEGGDGSVSALVEVARSYDAEEEWAEAAIREILDQLTVREDEAPQRLAALAEQYRVSLPRLAMGAWNRIGDLDYRKDDWVRAKDAYRTVIDKFPPVATPTAAARFALAEILYREERYGEATALYEKEMALHAEDAPLYQLARAAYIRKSLAAGESLFRSGEVSAARAAFLDLIRYEGRSLEAHRGYIKSVAAQGQAPELFALYSRMLGRYPDDPVLLYAAGLTQTYLPGKESLEQGDRLIARASERMPGSEYPFQTRGYIAEVMETVHGERGGLERALSFYRRAKLLNLPAENPDNAANLDLNIGNIAFLLGRNSMAWSRYSARLAAAVPFDNPDTELLFQQRYAAVAFQVHEKEAVLAGYGRALKLAEGRLDTARPIEQFGRLARRTVERLFPDRLQNGAREKALREQQDINAELELLGADRVDPPPSAAWNRFDGSVRALLAREKKLIDSASGWNPEQAKKFGVELLSMAANVERELDNVPRLVETAAEINDRLGLAALDAERFAAAREHFGNAFRLNRELGRTGNLAANRRSASIACYRQAEGVTGAEKKKLLLAARDGFREVLVLLDSHPPEKKKAPKRGGGLVNVAANVALDKSGSTQAAFGFSADQERRLAESYLARISADLGETETSASLFAKLRERYPKEAGRLADGDLFGVGLLTHRGAQLSFARGDRAAAAAGFRDATVIALRAGNTVGAMLNLVNWGELIPSEKAAAELPEFLKYEAQTASLVGSYRDNLPKDALARYGNDVGVILAGLAQGLPEDGSRQALLYRSAARLDRVLALPLPAGKNDEERAAARGRVAARLNRAAVTERLGMDEAAAAGYAASLDEARAAGTAPFAWRALAALGKYDEALSLLENLPPTSFDLRRGELLERFSPRVEALTAKDAEQGFAFVERLAEIERVQLVGRALLGLDEPSTVAALSAAAPHLAETDRVVAELARQKTKDAEYLKLRRQQEQTVVDGLLGKELELLPSFYAVAGPAALRLASFAAAVPNGGAPERERFETLLKGYRKECAAGKGGRFCSVLTPQPVEAIDVMERLSGKRMLRVAELSPNRFLLYTLDPKGGVKAETLDAAGVAGRLADPAVVAVYEDPARFSSANVLTWGITASQLLRSVEERKPLRTQVLDPAGIWPASPPFAKLPADSLPERLPDAHTVLLPGAAGLLTTVPNLPGEGGAPRAAWEDKAGGRHDFVSLAQGESVSLLIAPAAGLDAAYHLGQLASLVGIPSVIVAGKGKADLAPFAAAYAEESLSTARRKLPAGWLQVGDWGTDAVEGAKLAKKQFNDMVKSGVKAHNEGRYPQALAMFDNALVIAKAAPELSKHTAALHRYARESAFGAGLTERAVQHADLLVQRLAKEKPYSPEHADALFRLGLLQGRLERFKEATASLKEGVGIFAELGLTREQASALSDFGNVMENAVDYPAARSLFEEAAGLRAAMKDDASLADQYRNLGRIFDLRLNQYAVAEKYYAKAQELYARNGNRSLEAESILDRGRCERLLGNFPSADSLYRDALAKIGDGDLRTRMRIVLEQGNNAWFQGRYQDAFDLRDRVEKAAVKENWPLEQVMAKNTGGLIWWTLGDNKRALLELRDALDKAGKLEVRRDETATTLNNIGLVQRESGDYRGALETLSKALEIDRALNSRWAIAYDLRNTAQTRVKMGDPKGALSLLSEAAGLADAIGDKVNQAKIQLAFGDARLRSGEAGAEGNYRKALELADGMLLREVRWRALLGLARLAQGAGKNLEAVEAYRQALETVENLRAEIRLDQLKDGFLADKMDVYTGLVGLLVDLGRNDEAFEVAERSRARNLIDILGRQRLSLSGGGDGELYDRQNRLREQIMEQEQLSVQAAPSDRAMYAQALDRLRAQYQDLLLDIEKKRPELLSLVKVAPVSQAEIRSLLEPGVALLSYYQLSDRLLCWRLERDGAKLFILKVSARDLAEKMAAYRRMLQNLEPLEKTSRELFDLLLAEPLAGVGELKALGIVPHGSLHYLSFATLYDGRNYLVDREPIFHLPAASVLRHTLSRREKEKNLSILAIGNPDLGSASLDLPFAEKEAGTLRWNYSDVTLLTRERATESWVRENLARFGIIHIASHGEFDPVNPLFSSIRLAKDGKNDGKLQAEEVFGLDIRADLVVLSACQTGLGDIRKGDDVIGMNRAFLFAGTHALMSSLWRVSDVSSAILMKEFYRDYRGGDKAEALRLAMQHVRNRYPHPGYWGAFVLTGDYR